MNVIHSQLSHNGALVSAESHNPPYCSVGDICFKGTKYIIRLLLISELCNVSGSLKVYHPLMKQLDTYQKSDENHETCWDLTIYIIKIINP
jgi:hypothetical protein